MIPLLLPLPLDWSGKSPHNRTKGEIHNLGPQAEMPYRIIVMEKGYFYTEDLHMMDSRGYTLTENDYQCIAVNREIMDEGKKLACAVILITNPDVSNLVRVSAQMVGGKYCVVNQAIIEMAANVIVGANRRLYWKDITGKPDRWRPNGHLHALWEIFGFTEQTTSLKRITTAMDKIVAKDFEGLFKEFMLEFGEANANLDDIEKRLTTHIADKNDPHDITATQLSLQNVYNGPVATQTDAQSGSNQNRTSYTTPLRTKQMADSVFTPMLTQHINDVNNPHQDTAAKLGTMTNLEFRLEANKYYNRGETTARTHRIAGNTYQQYYDALRTNLAVNQITTGIFPQARYVTVPRGDGYILQPNASGYLEWQPFVQTVDRYITKGNNILYAGRLDGPISDNSSGLAPVVGRQIVNWLAGVLGTGHPEGTIAVYQYNRRWEIGASNGGVWTNLNTDGMAVIAGGVWTIPGYV